MSEYTKEDAKMDLLEEKALKEMDQSDLVIYDVPNGVRDKFISMAKLYYDDQGWKVLAEALHALVQKKEESNEELEERIDRLEEEMNIIKNMTKHSEEQRNDASNGQPTFGDLQETDVSEDLEKLKQLSQSRGDTNDKQ